jgi:hypothetical protein
MLPHRTKKGEKANGASFLKKKKFNSPPLFSPSNF